MISIIDFFLTLAIWGSTTTVGSRGDGMTTRRGGRPPAAGVAFLVVLPLLLGLSVGRVPQGVHRGATVTLETDSAGNQLQDGADVKVRGVIVGEVREVAPTATAPRSSWRSSPTSSSGYRPTSRPGCCRRRSSASGTSRSCCPRPRAGAARRRRRHRPGPQRNAIELERVLDDLLPLLQAVEPQDLAYTLGCGGPGAARARRKLGENLAATGRVRRGLDPVLPDLQADITQLADFADTATRADDLLAALDNLAITNRRSSTSASSCAAPSPSGQAPPTNWPGSWRPTSGN